MAKAKSKSSVRNRSSKVKTPAVPEGYKVLTRAPNWDMEKNPVVKGPRGKARTVQMSDRKVRTFTVDDAKLGLVTVWESGMLRDLFDSSEEGDNVHIEYLGLGKALKKDQSPPKLFQCAIAE